MIQLLVGGLLLGMLALQDGAVDPRLAPPPEEAAREAEEWVRNRKVGAALLWGGLLFASIIIGVVRARQRRARAGRSKDQRP